MSDLLIAAGQEPRGAVRRRLVGAALRHYREHLGFGLTEAASILDCDRSKISRIETGQRGIRPRELGDLLTEYGISGIERSLLLAITDPRLTRHGLWNQYADIVPAAHLDLMILELLASQILIYDPQQVPDLLQTQDYTHAAAQADPSTPDPGTISRLTEMNMIRRKIITDAHGTTVTAIIGEAALHQQIGNADVMHEQLRHLADATSTSPWDSLQILPFQTGTHPQHTTPMTILRFAEAPSLGVIHLRGLNGGVILTGQAAVADHIRAFTQLQASALPPQHSARMLSEMTETTHYAVASHE